MSKLKELNPERSSCRASFFVAFSYNSFLRNCELLNCCFNRVSLASLLSCCSETKKQQVHQPHQSPVAPSPSTPAFVLRDLYALKLADMTTAAAQQEGDYARNTFHGLIKIFCLLPPTALVLSHDNEVSALLNHLLIPPIGCSAFHASSVIWPK